MINNSGIGTYLKNLLPFFVNTFNVILLGEKQHFKYLKKEGEFDIIEYTDKIYSIKEIFLLPLKIPRCDLFWSPHFNTPILPIKAKNRIVTIHDVNHLVFPDTNFFKKTYAISLYRNAVKKSDKIITVSNFSKQEIIKYLRTNTNKIRVIHCGVNKKFLNPKNLEHNLNLPEKYFLFVGNVKPHKNLKVLLNAYLKLPKGIRQTYKIVIIGKKEGFITPDKEIFNLIEINNLSDNILFTGYIEDFLMPLVYKNATLFIFPSLYEGFGLPVLEAMLSKTPVLASNKASITEIAKKHAIYFNPYDEEELARKILNLLKDKIKRKGYINGGFKHAQTFSWQRSAEQHINIFKKFL